MPSLALPRPCLLRGLVLALMLALLVPLVAVSAAEAAPAERPERVPFQGTYRISRAFGHAGGHLPNPGIDFATPVGTPVRAAGNGTVIYSGSMCGNTVAVHHRDANRTSRYLHLSRRDVKVGDEVRRGDVVGLSGAHGCGSTGPHLHYDEVSGNSYSGSGRINPGTMLGIVGGEVRRYPDVFGGWSRSDERWVTNEGRDVVAAGSPVTEVVLCADDRTSTHTFSDVPGTHPFCTEIARAAADGIATGYAKNQFRPAADMSRQGAAAFLARSQDGDLEACARKPFSDVPLGNVFCDAVSWATGQGITTGYGDGTFRPARAVTRAQMAAFTSRMDGDEPVACRQAPFRDVPVDHPLCGEVARMAEAGVVGGYGDGTFRPDQTVDRQQAAALVVRLRGR